MIKGKVMYSKNYKKRTETSDRMNMKTILKWHIYNLEIG